MGIAEKYRGPNGRILAGTQIPIEETVEKLKDLFKEKPVLLAYLFGSYAEAGVKPEPETSDVDIAVLVESCAHLYDIYKELWLKIVDTLESERFDLIMLQDAPLALQFEIVSQGGLIFCRSEDVLNDFEMKTIQKYQDTQYLRRVQAEYLKKRAQEWYSRKQA